MALAPAFDSVWCAALRIRVPLGYRLRPLRLMDAVLDPSIRKFSMPLVTRKYQTILIGPK